MNLTDKGRIAARYAFFAVVACAVVGWFLDKDPSKLSGVIGWLAAAMAVGEGSNVGKRATFKKDATDG